MFPTRPRAGLFSHLSLAAAALLLPLSAGWAQTAAVAPASGAAAPVVAPPKPRALTSITPAEIEAAVYGGTDLPAGQSALTAKVQILLDRAGISPGVVDGWRGGMSESAIMAFQRRSGLPMTGRMDHAVWELLQGYAAAPLTTTYTITEEDAAGLVDRIPPDYAEKAAMTSQGYTSVLEKLAERFHMDEKFLAKLNPGARFQPGETIHATVPAKPIRATVTRIIVDKETRRVAAYDAKGNMVADYPATVGSSDTPSPHGNHVVDAVALNPTYTYNPHRNFKQGENDRVLIIPPGPNGPVGNVWIDLSEPTYGIHGTATPSQLFLNQSHGCVRLTNWDAWELAHMVKPKVTTVEFLPPGVRIADVTGISPVAAATQTAAVAAIAGTRPPARGDRLPPPASAAMAIPAAATAAEAAAATAATVVTPEPLVITPAGPAPDEPLVPETAPTLPAQDEPEYPSDAVLPESLPGQAPGSVTLYPQAGQP
ncbi:L,D-transpeptidase family protein [Paracoccus sp. P2]|uniref:L,D-transpeptidase family protein n=1 Tax=Paracoccus pantotrophus TaxID=82367 RepID=A0A7H9C001_PARPN|nr:L,D-transpeptidase [Paracoccus pantotrophus]MDF3855974.1 L,D-transpeptidase [Paracoccus pantotrophus]QLH15421.1 L,D-transpeptidase family protein [Paracoccus pantotrophus]RNI20541.1 murein L,D-transpeptidase [Paracoccus pantotrophus]SFO91808.1 Lipoprotein-anchoring transpeptidase ErfK/SrfK [Paracoccus pantotrophus]